MFHSDQSLLSLPSADYTSHVTFSSHFNTHDAPRKNKNTSEIAVLDHITFRRQWWLCIPPAVTFSDAAMTPTQCLYGFRSVLRIKRDCFPLYNRSSKQSHSVEDRNKICKQHSASCLNRISVPQNGRLHEASASLHGISCVTLRHGSLSLDSWEYP